VSFLTRHARAAEVDHVRRELEPSGGFLCIYADTTQEAIEVTRLALLDLPDTWRVATVDLGRCATTRDVVAALVRAVAVLYVGDPQRLDAILRREAGRDVTELIELAEAGGAPLIALLEDAQIEDLSALDIFGYALDALTRLAASQQVVLAFLGADELLAPERKSQLAIDPTLLWTLRARLQHSIDPPRLVLAGGPATVDLISDREEAFAGWGQEIAIPMLSSEGLQLAITRATELSGLGDSAAHWLPGIIRLAEGSAAVAGDLLELLWFGGLNDMNVHSRPRLIQDPDQAFLALVELNSSRIRQEVRLLKALDPAALPVAIAVARGEPPYAAVTYSSDTSRALRTLRRAGFATQRAPRTWALTDPLLAAWLRRPAAWGR